MSNYGNINLEINAISVFSRNIDLYCYIKHMCYYNYTHIHTYANINIYTL